MLRYQKRNPQIDKSRVNKAVADLAPLRTVRAQLTHTALQQLYE